MENEELLKGFTELEYNQMLKAEMQHALININYLIDNPHIWTSQAQSKELPKRKVFIEHAIQACDNIINKLVNN